MKRALVALLGIVCLALSGCVVAIDSSGTPSSGQPSGTAGTPSSEPQAFPSPPYPDPQAQQPFPDLSASPDPQAQPYGSPSPYSAPSSGGREYTSMPIQPPTITSVGCAQEARIYTNGNIAAVQNNPTQATRFQVSQPVRVTYLMTYHWNNARGQTPGRIGLRHQDGSMYGPWQAAGAPGQGGVPNAYWIVRPNVTLKPGTYSVVDSHPSTWAQNAQSSGQGMVELRGCGGVATAAPGGRDYTSLPIQPPPAAGLANLALRKPATQSSTGYGGDAGRAVDGNTEGNHNAGSVSHTNNQPHQWWQVDLGAAYPIQSVRIWNRTDCCAERLSRFYVFVSDTPMPAGNVQASQNHPGVWPSFFDRTAGRTTDIPVNRNGRYVRIQLSGADYLQLAEVEVFGRGAAATQPTPTPPAPGPSAGGPPGCTTRHSSRAMGASAP